MKVIVIGRSAEVWDEVAAAKLLTKFDKVVAVNVAGQDYPEQVDYWVSFHPNFFEMWIRKRLKKGLPYSTETTQLWSGTNNGKRLGARTLRELVRYANYFGGSSGLIATRVAVDHVKGDKVVLCGIPMENTKRYDDQRNWREALMYRDAWLSVMPLLKPYVRSMSGWTREQFGEPTKEWLDEIVPEEERIVGEGSAEQDAGQSLGQGSIRDQPVRQDLDLSVDGQAGG